MKYKCIYLCIIVLVGVSQSYFLPSNMDSNKNIRNNKILKASPRKIYRIKLVDPSNNKISHFSYLADVTMDNNPQRESKVICSLEKNHCSSCAMCNFCKHGNLKKHKLKNNENIKSESRHSQKE